MDVFEAIEKRRSIRKFSPQPIPEATIQKLLNAMRLAPSGKNAQPWKFILVRDVETKRKIADICQFYTGSGKLIRMDWIAEAPAIFVICGDPRAAFVKIKQEDHVSIVNWDFLESLQQEGEVDWESGILVDLTIPMDHLSLAAVAAGLGGCWVAGLRENKLKEILGIPEAWVAPAVMPIGYLLENPEPRRRKESGEVVCWERFL